MHLSRSSALALLAGLVVASVSLVGCSNSSDAIAPDSLASEAAEGQASADAASASYCDPLAAAYEIKPASGEPAGDADLAAFGEALLPAAAAAAADGRPDLADLFTLLSQVNAHPDAVSEEQVDLALTEVLNYSDEVSSTCGIDMLA